ncbi:MAG: type II 3-dehydroquinate dehydratase [Erysipelotrichaceae bacterium]
MTNILVINGVNLNMLGIRETNIYGNQTYLDLYNYIKAYAYQEKLDITIKQSNYEGEIVEYIQKAYQKYDGIIINAGAYSHTSIAILDALKSVNIPTIEVHLTNIKERESYRHHSYIEEYALKTISGFSFEGYIMAIKEMIKYLNENNSSK